MTLHDIVATMLRRWYLPVIAVSLACGMWVLLARDGGCFTTSTVVSFTLPSRATLLPESGVDDESVIAFAGVVAQEINGTRPAPRYASRDAPLYGVGVRQGVLVGLPNSGGQWVRSFARAEIEIQIVDRTAEEVETRQRNLLDRVFQITRDQQRSASPKQRIRASVVPLTAGIQEISATRSSQLLALVALCSSALIVGGWAAVRLDGWIVSSRMTRAAKSRTVTDTPNTHTS